MNKMIIIIILLGSMMQGAFAQNIAISGKTISARQGEPVEYANVVLNTTDSIFVSGATTDASGRFSIASVSTGNYMLSVSSMGYKTIYIPLNNISSSTTLNPITLHEDVVALEGVTVSASNLTSTSDRKMVYPSERQMKASSNGMNLLQQLMLPKLQVNPMSNEVSVPGGGEVQFRINGAKVEQQEIIALMPSEIIRIEFHDNPGLRYGNAEVVLDYIVRRPETGGSFGVSIEDAFEVNTWGNNNIRGKVNHKKSEFAVNYGRSHRDFKNMWRDNEETFNFADGSTLHRREEGEPDRWKMLWGNINATYSYVPSDKSMFNATLRYYFSDNPYMNYRGKLYNMANQDDYVDMMDRNGSKSKRPAIDLYYMQKLKNDQTLVFNLVGTYNYTDQTRIYKESQGDKILTDINNIVEGKKYSIIGEAIYEKKFGTKRISGGIRHNQSFSDNEYRNGHNYTTEMNQSTTSAYAELKGKVKSLDYTISAGVTRAFLDQKNDGEGYENYTFNPRVVLHYNLPGKQFIRLRADISNASPSLSELSAIDQTIDSIQIQRGNPNLEPYMKYRAELTYEYQKGLFYGNFWGVYEYAPDAIMDEKRLEGDKIVQTWDNQKNWQRLANRLTLRVGPIKDILQLSVAGGVNHYISNGNQYKHTYTNWFINADISATYKGFTLIGGLMTNWNWFYGETLNGGENLHYIMARYNRKNLSLGLGIMMPFMDNYKTESENRSKYASYKKSNYIKESSQLVAFQISYNFSFGRKFKDTSKRLNNSDNDSGIMNVGK